MYSRRGRGRDEAHRGVQAREAGTVDDGEVDDDDSDEGDDNEDVEEDVEALLNTRMERGKMDEGASTLRGRMEDLVMNFTVTRRVDDDDGDDDGLSESASLS